jgi:uncharacterized membrane protein YqjE
VGRRISGWIELLQSLRDAFIGVMQAEVRVLRLDLDLSKRHLVRALGLAALAIFVGFWAIGVLILLFIQVAAIWLPVWAASLVVLTVLSILGLALLLAARGNLRKTEAPGALLRRHVQEHLDWWEDEILPAGKLFDVGSLDPDGSEEDEVL